ncbi:hypothetical protein U9M48_014001, partial [Paspalum notatum var. saurae]
VQSRPPFTESSTCPPAAVTARSAATEAAPQLAPRRRGLRAQPIPARTAADVRIRCLRRAAAASAHAAADARQRASDSARAAADACSPYSLRAAASVSIRGRRAHLPATPLPGSRNWSSFVMLLCRPPLSLGSRVVKLCH